MFFVALTGGEEGSSGIVVEVVTGAEVVGTRLEGVAVTRPGKMRRACLIKVLYAML